ncbi:thymidylate kinase [Fructilactobacillus fructivorans]|uniref:dTMP kinase n=1 Tax=Fructilactobacillus fructivorans TaxID=1614 RepID=UPI0007052DE3|nr:dTMP kinase [Fructilactobacillus fructivorans]KRN12744.1 thymidylate kinase [Fructilactobacillus fructivorans]
MTGQFITFEGTDGAGKTTVLNQVVDEIKPAFGKQLLTTREPGGNPVSEQIRKVILNKDETDMDDRCEALLFAAARREHLVKTILPALKSNQLVLCDRYLDSSIAYQGGGREIGEKAVLDMNQFATEGLMPDTTIYFDVPVDVGLKRIANHRSGEVNRLDLQEHDFYVRVHDAYDRIAKRDPKRVIKIDATKPIDEVVNQVLSVLYKRAGNYFNKNK